MEKKQETRNNNQTRGKKFDLEERSTEMARRVVHLCKSVKPSAVNQRIITQLIGSAGSVGANYREANDALGKKDFVHRLKIARKEAKEAMHWFELIEEANPEFISRMKDIKQEANELKNILSSIINKTQQ